MGEWQPIETAPKDGSEVLLFSPRKSMIWIGYYTTHARTGEGGWIVSQLTGLPEFCPWQPTRWMPLPAPPVSGLESSSEHPAKHEQNK